VTHHHESRWWGEEQKCFMKCTQRLVVGLTAKAISTMMKSEDVTHGIRTRDSAAFDGTTTTLSQMFGTKRLVPNIRGKLTEKYHQILRNPGLKSEE